MTFALLLSCWKDEATGVGYSNPDNSCQYQSLPKFLSGLRAPEISIVLWREWGGGWRRRCNGGDLAQKARWGLNKSVSCQEIYSASHKKMDPWWTGRDESLCGVMAAILASLCTNLGILSFSPLLNHLLLGSHICPFLGWRHHFSITFLPIASQDREGTRQIWEKFVF